MTTYEARYRFPSRDLVVFVAVGALLLAIGLVTSNGGLTSSWRSLAFSGSCLGLIVLLAASIRGQLIVRVDATGVTLGSRNRWVRWGDGGRNRFFPWGDLESIWLWEADTEQATKHIGVKARHTGPRDPSDEDVRLSREIKRDSITTGSWGFLDEPSLIAAVRKAAPQVAIYRARRGHLPELLSNSAEAS